MMDVTIYNPDGSSAGFSLLFYQIDKYFDKPGTCELTLNPFTTIQKSSTLEASFKGSVRFRGYIDYPELNDDQTIRVVAYEQQRLLEYRYTQPYEYPAGTSLLQILSSNEPSVCVGLLYMANSLIPQGSFKLYSGNVYYIKDYLDRGGGTSSRFGPITKIYANTTLLTKGSSPSLSSGQWYQDSNDLYVRMPDDRDPKYWLVSIPNWKDTKIRLSANSVLNGTLTVPYRVGRTQILEEILRLIMSFGQEHTYKHDNDGYTYLYTNTTIGRGSPTNGMANFRENDTIYVYTEEQTGNPRIDGLIGTGSGSGVTQEVASLLDLYNNSIWKEDVYSDPHQFSEQMENTLKLVLPDMLNPFSYTIVTDEDPALNPGDYANIIKNNAMPITKRVKKISYTSESEMTVEMGQRLLDISDVTKSKFDMIGAYNDFVNSYASSWTFTFNNDSITNSVPFQQSFKVNLDEIDQEYPYRFLLNVNIGWYKETKGNVDSAAHSHSGATGGGGSHGHGGATAYGGAHPHYASGTTQGYTGYAITVLNGVSVSSSGAHSHSMGCGGGGGHGHSATLSGYVSSAPGYVTVSGSTTSVGDHAHNISCGSGGSHSHSVSTTTSEVAGAHSHYLPASVTTYNSDDNRGIYTQDNHTNPMITENARATIQDNFCMLLGTGNSIHYLTLTIKINGTNVSGSPFPNYYPGDSITDIDITNLINIGSDNIIWIGISEYGGSGPVRCSVNGSVTSKYFITTL